ncbi:DegT/DnrJ/EryC1/StrS family aminotransferase [Streptomyces sp. NPDC057424]|uniref:DegT/DnrJ/EryC1/StrS family aminotransferase n=1 Tax=Streptomyces sp. NPDC057424 TaxID=3346127 RepID=UPI00369A9C8D
MQVDFLRKLLHEEPALRFAAGGVAEFHDWRGQVRAVVERLVAAPDRTFTVAALAVEESAGIIRRQYVFQSGAAGELRGTLLAPSGAAHPRPAVLVCPGRNATLGGVTGTEAPDHADRNVAEQLTRAGFVTLTLDYGLRDHTAPDGSDGRDTLSDSELTAFLAQAFVRCGYSLLGALVTNTLAALDWLRGHPLVGGEPIGVFGHSMGGAVALHTALLHREPVALCAASAVGTYRTLNPRLLTCDPAFSLPGILRHADIPDLFGALAPAPVQLQYGDADPFLDDDEAAAAADAVRQAYAAAGAAERVEVLRLAMGHGTAIPHAITFFARALRGEEALRGPEPEPTAVPAARVFFDRAARREILDRIDGSLASGTLTLGPSVEQFEELAAARVGRGGVALSSGTAALEIALRVLDVAGKTVLVPANTFFATAAAAVHAGADVAFVDMELDGLGLDPDALRAALENHESVAAVIAVHIGGIVSPALKPVLEECRYRGIPVIEDAAHALGSRLNRQPAGSFTRFGAFSLYPTKVATSGEGGIITSGEESDLAQARRFRDQGKVSAAVNLHDRLGHNWRMSELHASVGIAQLHRLDQALGARMRLAAWYDAHLGDVPGLRPYIPPYGVESNHYKYVAFLQEGIDRAALKTRLRRRHAVSLAGEVYDTLLCDQPFFAAQRTGGAFRNARWFASHHICLPLFPTMTESQQKHVVGALRAELS